MAHIAHLHLSSAFSQIAAGAKRHLHFNSDFLSFFVLLSYGTIGVLRGHLVIFFLPLSYRTSVSNPRLRVWFETNHTTTTPWPLRCVTFWFGPFDSVPSHVSSIYVQVHNSQWDMFSSQRFGLLPAVLSSIRRQLYDVLSRIEESSLFCARLTTLNLWDG